MAVPTGILFSDPQNTPINAVGLSARTIPNATRQFLSLDGVTLATVYQDAALQFPFSQDPFRITADGQGRFPVIYMDPGTQYRVKLFTAAGVQLEDVFPYIVVPYNPLVKVKQVTTARVGTTTLVSDPELFVNIANPGTYIADIRFGGAAAGAGATSSNPGLSVSIAFSGTLDGGSINAGVTQIPGSNIATVLNTAQNVSTLGGVTINFCDCHVVFTCTTPGVLSLNWAQQTVNTGIAMTMLAGSTMFVTPVA